VALEFDDRVLECATLARRLAPARCRRDPVSGDDCSWYHGFWPYLRAIGIVTTPTSHAGFYGGVLEELAATGDYRRVLVSGSADFTMLQHVFSAYAAAGAELEPTFNDICETPVALARWYAEAVGRPVDTCVSDILALDVAAPFDVVCTHSFLGYFDDRQRAALMTKWHRLLRPGGKVVTIIRIRPDHPGGLVGFTDDQAAAFKARALEAAGKYRRHLDISPAALAEDADRYARNFRINPLRSVGELERLFTDGGFAIDALDLQSLPGHGRRAGSGPTTPDGAAYAHIVVTGK